MTDTAIIQNIIRSLGQSQHDRLSPALNPDFIKMDERGMAEYLEALKQLAIEIPFFDTSSGVGSPEQNWSTFFPFADAQAESWLASLGDDTPPHMGLLLAFLNLFEHAQKLLNDSTRRHLKFYYEEVLRLQHRSATPDRAHVIVTLKKLVADQLISPTMQLSAGKDANSLERLYRPVRESVVNQATVSSLRSLFMDDAGRLRYAPVANSLDGLGTPPKKGEALSWSGFGHAELPLADVGFALSAPVLAMAEGRRTIRVSTQLNNTGELHSASLENAFSIFLTGEKAWLGPLIVSPELKAGELRFSFVLDPSDAAVIGHDNKIHGNGYETSDPILQVLLNKDRGTPYRPFHAVELESVRIDVEVEGIRSLDISNEFGKLNPARKFVPFGSQAKRGTRLTIRSKEIFSKQLSRLELALAWEDTPVSFRQHYANYGVAVSNDSFTANVTFTDGAGWQPRKAEQTLFNSVNGQSEKLITFSRDDGVDFASNPKGALIYTLAMANSQWSSTVMNQLVLGSPVTASAGSVKAEPRQGELICVLNRDFLHKTYRRKVIENVVNFSKATGSDSQLAVLEDPVVPAIGDIGLNYHATSGDIPLTDGSVESYADASIKFFQVGYFGHMREHKFIREQFAHVESKSITLFNTFAARGEFILGLDKLSAGDSVALLVQLAEGSSDPDLVGESIAWSVLCDNYWKILDDTQLVLDSSYNLLSSGILQFLIPGEATTSNSLLPSGYLWIKGSIQGGEAAVSRVIDIIANAIEVEFALPVTPGVSAQDHLAAALPAGSIFKFKNTVTNVKKVEQPYASFAGETAENDQDFNTRTSENIRHKGRCITPWDYERCVLAHFPNIHKVKCIPHASPESWSAPGNVLVVLIPDLTNRKEVDLLQPRVDSRTLTRVHEKLVARSGPQISLHVASPRYQAVQVSLEVRFRKGCEFNYYRGQLDTFIQATLSPWAFAQASVEIEFGGVLYDSSLLKAIEDLQYVDYVSDFVLLTQVKGRMTTAKGGVMRASEPDIILVSVITHDIREAPQ